MQDPSATEDQPKPAYNKTVDQLIEEQLLWHLSSSLGHYNRMVWLQMDPTERRLYLEAALSSRPDQLAAIDERPLAVSGKHVAFPYDGPVPNWVDKRDEDPQVPIEAVVTLPTRGLFAEAQLSHCNSCEKRDVTRMWD